MIIKKNATQICAALFLYYRKHLLFENVVVDNLFSLTLTVGVGVPQVDFHAGVNDTCSVVVRSILNAFGSFLEGFFRLLHDMFFLAAENESADSLM